MREVFSPAILCLNLVYTQLVSSCFMQCVRLISFLSISHNRAFRILQKTSSRTASDVILWSTAFLSAHCYIVACAQSHLPCATLNFRWSSDMRGVEFPHSSPVCLSPTPQHAVFHELASISFQSFFMCSRFFFATSRLCAVRSSRAARRHLLTCVLASLHMPIDFHRKPRAWHSSRAFMSSSQPGCVSQRYVATDV